jgi:hypothetical protein
MTLWLGNVPSKRLPEKLKAPFRERGHSIRAPRAAFKRFVYVVPRKYIIKVLYGSKAYLFTKKEGKQVYIARLDDLNTISEEMGKPKEEVLEIVLDLVRSRRANTKRNEVRELMDVILFDPYLYFGLE